MYITNYRCAKAEVHLIRCTFDYCHSYTANNCTPGGASRGAEGKSKGKLEGELFNTSLQL